MDSTSISFWVSFSYYKFYSFSHIFEQYLYSIKGLLTNISNILEMYLNFSRLEFERLPADEKWKISLQARVRTGKNEISFTKLSSFLDLFFLAELICLWFFKIFIYLKKYLVYSSNFQFKYKVTFFIIITAIVSYFLPYRAVDSILNFLLVW